MWLVGLLTQDQLNVFAVHVKGPATLGVLNNEQLRIKIS